MSTIKIKNGKVLLKNGKAACECCVPDCYTTDIPITSDNCFEITKEEYINYYKGGNWIVTHEDQFALTIIAYGSLGRYTQKYSGNGSKNFNYQTPIGCKNGFSGYFDYPSERQWSWGGYTGFISEFHRVYHSVGYNLFISNKRFYVFFDGSFSYVVFGSNSPLPVGIDSTCEIDGNNIKLSSSGVWASRFDASTGNSVLNNSTSNLTVTFIPNP